MSEAPGGPARRLFFALWPDEAQRASLAHAIHKGVRACGGRPVPEHNLHVTLAFLGSVPEARLAELDAIARAVAAEPLASAPLPMVHFDRLEHWARPQILVATSDAARTGEQFGAAAHDVAHSSAPALAATLKERTVAAGFSPDLKPFRAHVTVARKVRQAVVAESTRVVHWECAHFALIDSRTESRGPLYSVVASYLLANAAQARKSR